MLDGLSQLFSAVCGQNPAHTWAPGGLLLPCCQRCTGLYAGAALAALLHWTLKPKLTARFLELHGLFLLLMVPFGFHWVAHGPVMRSITGVLFGFGLVAFLSLNLRMPPTEVPTQRRKGAEVGRETVGVSQRAWRLAYWLGLGAAVAGVPVAAAGGGQVVAYLLATLCAAGSVALGLLALVNVTCWVRAGCRLLAFAFTSRRLCVSAPPRLCVKGSRRPS